MGQIDQAFHPPRYWQQFEDLTHGCFREILGDQFAVKNGRSGFPQAGVDVYGNTRDGFTGIQCKQADPLGPNGEVLPGGPLTKGVLLNEVAKAEAFDPKLKVFILATTTLCDPKLLQVARTLSERRQAEGKFRVVLWYWDDYRSFLNTSLTLLRGYYEDVLKIFNQEDGDVEILRFFAEAFDRPAFEHPLSVEDFNDFPQALEDTQTALRTGQLFDRRTRTRIRQSLSWRRLSDPRWREGLARVDKHLSDLRIMLLKGKEEGLILEHNASMQIGNARLRNDLEALRSACVDELNQVLREAKIDRIG